MDQRFGRLLLKTSHLLSNISRNLLSLYYNFVCFSLLLLCCCGFFPPLILNFPKQNCRLQAMLYFYVCLKLSAYQ